MEQGYIKMWNDERGFGFIGRPGEQDVFLHISMVTGMWRPQKGDKVAFDIEVDERGRLRAKNVWFIPYTGQE